MSFWMSSFVGNFRESNEDCFVYEKIGEFVLMILADGMGGHKNGEIASSNAVKIVKDFVRENLNLYKNYSTLLVDALCEANKIIYEENLKLGNSSDIKSQMGTTIETVLIHDTNMFYAHVGDSRIYSKYKDEFRQLTTDHSYAQFLFSKGAITELELKNHSEKNKLLRAIGSERFVDVDISTKGLRKGEIILICSDGLTNELNDFEISAVLDLKDNPREMVEELIERVKTTTPARDNVTVGIYKNEV